MTELFQLRSSLSIVRIPNRQFVSHDLINDVIRFISLNEQEKNGLSCIWSMFSTISRYSTKKAGQYVKELPKPENKIENLLLVCYLLSFFVETNCRNFMHSFRAHCIISASFQAFDLNLSTATNFDTLISNLKLNFQYDIVMTSK